MTTTIDWADIWYSAVFTHEDGSCLVDVTVYRIAGLTEDETPLFQTIGWQSSSDTTTDRAKAQPAMTGDVKWDGCSNFDFDTRDCMAHFCGIGGLLEFSTLLRRIHHQCGKMIPSTDADCFEKECP